MKARNNDKVRSSVLRFSRYLIALVALAVCIFSSFMKTSSVEVHRILEKTGEYDLIQSRQINLTEKMDTLYYYASLLNSDPQINYPLMQSIISSKKMQFINELSDMSDRDCHLYKKLAGQMNIFFDTKDSVKISRSEEDAVRTELLRRVSEYKDITRKISTGRSRTTEN